MRFERSSFEKGGKITIPHSFVSKTEPGEIVDVTHVGLTVTWHKDTERAQTAFYSYHFLESYYGKKDNLNDSIPF